jgi:hypothetical protein
MKNQKFYDFVRKIAKDDQALAESIVLAHQAIYESESINEGKLGNLVKAGALSAALATGAFAGDNVDPAAIAKEATVAVQQIQDEYLDEMDMATNDAYKQANARYNQLLKLDPKAANHYARVINMQLHKTLGIAAPPIGKQMAK